MIPRGREASMLVFRALLWMYPQPFRDSYGKEMTQTFRDLLQAEEHAGAVGYIRLWTRTIVDVAGSVIRERGEVMNGRSLLLLGATAMGLAICWVDSRPGWDDTGISVGCILLVSALLGAVSPKRAWQWGLSIGIWIPLYNLIWTHNYGAFLALVPAFVGAYIGAGVRTVVQPPPSRV